MRAVETDLIDHLFALIDGADALYGGEAVTQRAHALQCAAIAARCHEPPAVIVAALFHDVGHLIHELGEDCAERGIDDTHEGMGARLLEPIFPPSVTEPVRLHVNAKRYLCATEPDYWATLSDASKTSLELQGGAYDGLAAASFINQPHAAAAVRLRRYDDLAKDPDAVTPQLDHYREAVERLALNRQNPDSNGR